MEVTLDTTLVVLTTALFLAALIERIAEWSMPVINWVVVGVVGLVRRLTGYSTALPYVWEGPAKLLGVSLFNGVFYWLFFSYDFVGPLIESMTEASISGWRGLLLSILLIAGGSNLIHQVFTKKEAVVFETNSIRMDCP